MTITSELMSDMISPELLDDFQQLNEEQRKIVIYDNGPVMVIAGPGSGKTRCLTLRAMNLLLLKKALPQELVLCTYTEKAAFEMQDRLSMIAHKVEYHEDISQMHIGTIHSICNRIITENLHRIPTPDHQMPPLGNNYTTLDQLTQRLFIFENLDAICGKDIHFFVNRWGSKWAIVKQLQKYFEKITEELIMVRQLFSQQDYLLTYLVVSPLSFLTRVVHSKQTEEVRDESETLSQRNGAYRGPKVCATRQGECAHPHPSLGLAETG